MAHKPVDTAVSFGLMIAVVGGSFYYVFATHPKEPWTGITGGLFITPEAVKALGLDQDHGFLVFTIAPESPADKARLQGANETIIIGGDRIPVGGDIIVSMDNKQINGIEDVCSILRQKEVGDSLRLAVSRNGSLRQADLILGEFPPNERPTC